MLVLQPREHCSAVGIHDVLDPVHEEPVERLLRGDVRRALILQRHPVEVFLPAFPAVDGFLIAAFDAGCADEARDCLVRAAYRRLDGMAERVLVEAGAVIAASDGELPLVRAHERIGKAVEGAYDGKDGAGGHYPPVEHRLPGALVKGACLIDIPVPGLPRDEEPEHALPELEHGGTVEGEHQDGSWGNSERRNEEEGPVNREGGLPRSCPCRDEGVAGGVRDYLKLLPAWLEELGRKVVPEPPAHVLRAD